MTLAVIDWLSISINLLLVLFFIICLLMTLLIMMQRPKQEGLGAAFGAGVTDQVFGARTTNVLQRGTVYLASLFFVLALTLAILIGHKNKKTSILAPADPAAKVEEIQPETPQEEIKPKSLSEELPIEEATPADAPDAAPSTPETPDTPPAPADTSDAAPAADLEAAPETTTAPEPTAPADDAPATSEEKSGEP